MEKHHESTNVFSLSDQVLSDKLHFVEEIGFGNWGSVWLCRPKCSPASPTADDLDKLHDTKIAVKLVHRAKTPTTAARVRSLWNEMKIIKTFTNDPHPSIIPFHSFIITPSYALITMAFLPTLIPVEVEEHKAKEWFRSLLSGVEFLHMRGVVHNDIKPANILLSYKNVPVLVDFGFAEKYDLRSSEAFHSNLSYGTPEYLSPERARGLLHDSRKSDVWSLGITFFEILVGRTPFEHSDTEQFTTQEELETYWSRTLRGKWVGTWKMSKGMEKLLRKMIAPNADLRYTAAHLMSDPYWHHHKGPPNSHKRSASASSSLVLEDMSKVMKAPWLSRSRRGKENAQNPPLIESLARAKQQSTGKVKFPHVKSPSKALLSKPISQPKKRVAAPLSPINASPAHMPRSSAADKENILTASLLKGPNTRKRVNREALSSINILNRPSPILVPSPEISAKEKDKHRRKALKDLTGMAQNVDKVVENCNQGKSSVIQRMKEWEEERARLREISQREDQWNEEEVCAAETNKVQEVSAASKASNKNRPEEEIIFAPHVQAAVTPSDSHKGLVFQLGKEWALNTFKHSLKASIDKTMRLYKTSAPLSRSTAESPMGRTDDTETRGDTGRSAKKSSLPAVKHATHDERVAADNRRDRMAMWMKNVEKVVEDARQTFSSTSVTPVPPLPVAPLAPRSVDTRSARLPRKVLTANQIFVERPKDGSPNQPTSLPSAMNSSSPPRAPGLPPKSPSSCATVAGEHGPITPRRTRRATVTTRSPHSGSKSSVESGSPSKRKAKSRSHGNLLQPISPVSILELELKRRDKPTPSPRICEVLDRSLFVASPVTETDDASIPSITLPRNNKSVGFEELTSSPFIVEPYPPRKMATQSTIPDTPTRKRLESMYDRILVATSGVKRLGRGYQSHNSGPVGNVSHSEVAQRKRSQRVVPQADRRPIPPPVFRDDFRRPGVMVDELGVLNYDQGTSNDRDEAHTTAAMVRRAIKAIVAGKSTLKRTPS